MRMPELERMLAGVSSESGYEDRVYRLYHGSFKAYQVQHATLAITRLLKSLLPGLRLNRSYTAILRQGVGRVWRPEHNENFAEIARPMLEAFFHARFFLEMAVAYGRALEEELATLPTGWAALCYLWNIR